MLLKKIFPLKTKEWLSLVIIIICIIAIAYIKLYTKPRNYVSDMPVSFTCYSGIVKEITRDIENNIISILIDTGDADGRIINIPEEIICVNYTDKIEGNLNDIQIGQKIYAYSNMISMTSLPPQSTAFILLVNAENNNTKACYSIISDKRKYADSLSIRLVGDDSEYVIDSSTEIVTYKNKMLTSMKDLKEESEVVVWHEKGTNKISKVILIK